MCQNVCGRGSALGYTERAYSALLDPLAGFGEGKGNGKEQCKGL